VEFGEVGRRVEGPADSMVASWGDGGGWYHPTTGS
jgi:hypothetical protein